MAAGRIEYQRDIVAKPCGQIAGALHRDGAAAGFQMDERLVAKPLDQPDAAGQHGRRVVRRGQGRMFGADAKLDLSGRQRARVAWGYAEGS